MCILSPSGKRCPGDKTRPPSRPNIISRRDPWTGTRGNWQERRRWIRYLRTPNGLLFRILTRLWGILGVWDWLSWETRRIWESRSNCGRWTTCPWTVVGSGKRTQWVGAAGKSSGVRKEEATFVNVRSLLFSSSISIMSKPSTRAFNLPPSFVLHKRWGM